MLASDVKGTAHQYQSYEVTHVIPQSVNITKRNFTRIYKQWKKE